MPTNTNPVQTAKTVRLQSSDALESFLCHRRLVSDLKIVELSSDMGHIWSSRYGPLSRHMIYPEYRMRSADGRTFDGLASVVYSR